MAEKIPEYDSSKKQTVQEADTEPLRALQSWSISIAEIFSGSDVRLDATHFDPQAAGAIRLLKNSGLELKQLSDIASVVLCGQFARIWANDEKHGIPYLNATDILSLLALGAPAGGLRYLSPATDTDINRLIIREGWLLMTCSGTIGRVFYVPKRLDGWAATHDLIRIVANDTQMTGYLYAWLSTPLAQAQILCHTHGGQIDHVTDAQVSGILVPLFPLKEMKRINKEIIKAHRAREMAMMTLMAKWIEL